MTGNGGVKPTNSSPRQVGPADEPQGTEVPLTNMRGLTQRKSPTNPAASAPTIGKNKTLMDSVERTEPGDGLDLGDDVDSRSRLAGDELRKERKTGPSAGNVVQKSPPAPNENLKWTRRAYERFGKTLLGLANSRGLSDEERLNIDRDVRLAAELIEVLERKKLKDESSEAQDARSFMEAVLNFRHGRRHMTHAFRPGRTEENTCAEKRAEAIRFVRANRPSLGVAGDALVNIDDLYTDILNEPRLAPRLTAAQRKQLGRDRQTLRDLFNVAKINGWLPAVDRPDPDSRAQKDREDNTDSRAQNYMQDKISELAASISDHVDKILTTNGKPEDDAELEQLRRGRRQQVRDAKTFLSAAANSYIPPGTAPRVVVARQQVADALVKAHPRRGREIMDSLPPGYIAHLLDRGVTMNDIARRLTRCADLLHVSQSGFGESFWKGIRFSNGRALSSWQAAQVRRSVAMLVLAGAPKSEIRKVRDSLVNELRAASGRIGTKGKQMVEGSVSFLLWDKQSTYSLSEYRQEIERTVAHGRFTEKERWVPLTNLHTVMDNLSTVLRDPGCSADDALRVFKHDMKALGAKTAADPDAVEENDEVPFSEAGTTPGQLTGTLPGIDQSEHPYAHFLTPAVEGPQDN